MGHFEWDSKKNEKLGKERGVVFEDVVAAIAEEGLLDDFPHPDQRKYPGQRVMAIKINDYAYLVPYVTNEDFIFLKTIIPSRKATKKYL